MKPFTELTGREKSLEVLRWISVPVAAVLVVIVLGLILRVVMPPMPARLPGSQIPSDPNFHRVVLSKSSLAITGAAIVIVGAKTAPRYRRVTALVVSVVWVVLAFMSHIAVHIGQGRPNYDDFGIVAAGTACGVAYIIYSEKRRSRTDLA